VQTGDDPAHDVWMQSEKANAQALATLAGLMRETFADVPVFHSLGNHEAFPVNQYKGPGGDAWLLDQACESWEYWVRRLRGELGRGVRADAECLNRPQLPRDALKTLQYGGFYTARARPGLRIIAINSNYYPTGWTHGNVVPRWPRVKMTFCCDGPGSRPLDAGAPF
jgi:hypothetical protein